MTPENRHAARTPPRPNGGGRGQQDGGDVTRHDRRGEYASMKIRADSNSSTRGAFGPIPHDASAANPEDVFQKQQHSVLRQARNEASSPMQSQEHISGDPEQGWVKGGENGLPETVTLKPGATGKTKKKRSKSNVAGKSMAEKNTAFLIGTDGDFGETNLSDAANTTMNDGGGDDEFTDFGSPALRANKGHSTSTKQSGSIPRSWPSQPVTNEGSQSRNMPPVESFEEGGHNAKTASRNIGGRDQYRGTDRLDSLNYSDMDLPTLGNKAVFSSSLNFRHGRSQMESPLMGSGIIEDHTAQRATESGRHPAPSASNFATKGYGTTSTSPAPASAKHDDIASFAAMAQNDYGVIPGTYQSSPDPQHHNQFMPPQSSKGPSYSNDEPKQLPSCLQDKRLDVEYDENGEEHPHQEQSDHSTYTSQVRCYIECKLHSLFYDPENPEFTSLQQFSWAVILGIFMGVFTAKWGQLIEFCVDFVWVDIPEKLLEMGVFTGLDGHFPLPHYMWVCPAVFGGVLSYICAALPVPIPLQNEWIESLHRIGIIDHSTFFHVVLISTAGMASGLTLGPELPLVLSGGMVGSFLGLITRQSVLSARVMNLTAASAAIGGFFGFPMAGALFVLEIPHRMGLQYFEALSPATISSIVAVLANRMVTGNDVTGYFNYPFLTATLPSHIFYLAILYGLVGSVVGIFYAEASLKLKGWVHAILHYHTHVHVTRGRHGHRLEEHENGGSENVPLVVDGKHKRVVHQQGVCQKIGAYFRRFASFGIKHEPTRAAFAGVCAGIGCGVISMFLPHTLFWGEAQLQTLIDKGRTPLPIFGVGDEPTAILTAYGYCLIDPDDEIAITRGFSIACAGLITFTKIVTVGLSLGTGIVGGHFWGPLFVGAAASHLFTGLMEAFTNRFGYGEILSTYPCVAILCIMGSTHVVTFRAHMAIMLILTLTISAFAPESDSVGGYTGGDYSAVFPLLVVSCFVSVMLTRATVFYKKQRCRGDIIASPQVLCEPNKEGTPDYPIHSMADSFDDDYDSYYSDDESYASDNEKEEGSFDVPDDRSNSESALKARRVVSEISPDDIEWQFEEMKRGKNGNNAGGTWDKPGSLVSSRLDELLAVPLESSSARDKSHRRIKSTSDALTKPYTMSPPDVGAKSSVRQVRANSADRKIPGTSSRNITAETSRPPVRKRSDSNNSRSPSTMARVSSYGELQEFQPSLMNQARTRASSAARVPPSDIRMIPKGRHSRKSSGNSGVVPQVFSGNSSPGALSPDDVERAYSSVTNLGNGGIRRSNF